MPADALASHDDVLRDVSTADEWSSELHRALLTRPFCPRPGQRERLLDSDGVPPGSILIKVLPHHPSKTLAVLVLPLSTLTPLYEGLSLRTLQRRTKSNPPLSSSNEEFTQAFTLSSSSSSSSSQGRAEGGDSDAFAEIVDALELALRRCGDDSSDADTETWIDCDIGRSEASLTLHLKRRQWKLSIDFDLSSLDRDEGPTVVRDHLLSPLAGLALQAIQPSDPADSESQSAATTTTTSSTAPYTSAMLLLSRLLDTGNGTGDRFSNYSQRIHGIQAVSPDAPSVVIAPTSSTRPPSSVPEPSTPSRRSPDKKLTTESTPAMAESSARTTARPQSPSGAESDGDSDDSGELVLYHATPTSHPSSHSRDSRNSSARRGDERQRDREAVAEAQADPQRATPTPSTRPRSQSQAHSQHGRDLEAEMGLRPGDCGNSTSGTETDSDGEADETITSAPPTKTKRIETRVPPETQLPPQTFESLTPSLSPRPPASPSLLPTPSPQAKKASGGGGGVGGGGGDGDADMDPPSTPGSTTAVKDTTTTTTGATTSASATPAASVRKGKGAQNYSRGLAKRKRI